MHSFQLFLIEIGLGLAASLLIILFWSRPLKRVLIDTCGTEDRAVFWLTYCNIMIVIAPMLSEIVFGVSHITGSMDFNFLKTAFGSALFGIFLAIAVIGFQIAKFLPRPHSIEPSKK